MRNAFLGLVGMMIFSFSTAYSSIYFTNGYIKTGTYESRTTDSVTGQVFVGRVIIEPYGTNYRIIWKENDRIILTGIGILKGDIFSVSFCDLDGNKKGVLAYELVSNYELNGKWAYMNDCVSGTERLMYLHCYTN